jgi:hypothetical protein
MIRAPRLLAVGVAAVCWLATLSACTPVRPSEATDAGARAGGKPLYVLDRRPPGFRSSPDVTLQIGAGNGWAYEGAAGTGGSGVWRYSGPPIHDLERRTNARRVGTVEREGVRQTMYSVDAATLPALIPAAAGGRPPAGLRDAVLYVATRRGRAVVTVLAGLDARTERDIAAALADDPLGGATTGFGTTSAVEDRLLTELRLPGRAGCPDVCGLAAASRLLARTAADQLRSEWRSGSASIALTARPEPCGTVAAQPDGFAVGRELVIGARTVKLAEVQVLPNGAALGFPPPAPGAPPSRPLLQPGAVRAVAACIDQADGSSVDVWVVGRALDDRALRALLAGVRRAAPGERAKLLRSARVVSARVGTQGGSGPVAVPLPVPDPLPPDEPGRLISRTRLPSVGDREAYGVLFHSRDGSGGDVAVSGRVSVPKEVQPGAPVVVQGRGTAGLGDGCAAVSTPDARARRLASVDRAPGGDPYPADAIVVRPDYLGHGGTPGPHPYLDPVTMAQALLDGARVARAFGGTGPVVFSGFSEGAAGVLDAGARWKAYAPELDVRGVVASGVPTRVADVHRYLGAFPGASGYIQDILFGIIAAHPELDPADVLTESGLRWLSIATRAERSPFCRSIPLLRPDRDLRFDPASVPAWRAAMEATDPDRLPIPVPTLLVSESGDTTTPPQLADSVCHHLAVGGTDVRMWRYEGGGHGALPTQADQRRWLDDRLRAAPLTDGVRWAGPVPTIRRDCPEPVI